MKWTIDALNLTVIGEDDWGYYSYIPIELVYGFYSIIEKGGA